MKIFLVTETLLAGGAEWFVLRLSEALSRRGHSVSLFILRPDLVDERLTSQFKDIPRVHVLSWKIRITTLLDRILKKIGIGLSLTNKINCQYLKRHITQSKPDVIHSHLLTSDVTIVRANESFGVRHIATIHGDYIQAIKNGDKETEVHIRHTIAALDSIVSISDEQINILSNVSSLFKVKISKIYNGYPISGLYPDPSIDSTFNFGMIARGIPEKGWEQAIKAFIKIKHPDARLFLFGEGQYLAILRGMYNDPRIVFAGFSDQPLQSISKIHVGLLPSYYDAESLPTTIIEYLALAKPVIVSSVGEIPRMIETENQELAGILIDSKMPDEMVDPIYQAMSQLMLDTDLYQQLSCKAQSAFKKFSMDKCVDAYLSVYSAKPVKICAV